jgi:hypothetical protein
MPALSQPLTLLREDEPNRSPCGARRRYKGGSRCLIGDTITVFGYSVLQGVRRVFRGQLAEARTVTDANAEPPTFQVCLHDALGAPNLPAKAPSHSDRSHCTFWFARSHLAPIEPPPVVFQRVHFAVTGAWAANKRWLFRLSAYSIATPRGPPLSA